MTEDFNLEPPNGLLEKILIRIHREERILVLRKTIIFSTTLALSLIALVPSFNVLLSDLSQSGFINFFSLMFSDLSVVTKYWQNFAMILLETLPTLSLALFLAIILTFLQSAKSLFENIKTIKNIHNLTTN